VHLYAETDKGSRILEQLDHKDRLSVSLLDSQFRRFSVPDLFHSIAVSTDDKRIGDLSRLCKKYGQFVERLHLRCQLHPNPDSTSEDGARVVKPIRECLAQAFQHMVSGKSLPRMRSLQVTFLPEDHFMWGENWEDPNDEHNASIYVHFDPESYDSVVSSEAIYTWRLVMNDLFTSMAANASIRVLELTDLVPKTCSIWRSTELMCFLDRIEDIKIGLWGGQHAAM